jgi:hypothetical protein
MAPCRMMVDNPMQEDRLVVPASEVRGRSELFAGGQSWQAQGGMVLIESLRVDRAGRSRQEWICAGSQAVLS